MLPTHRKLPQGLAIASQSAEFWRRLAPDLTISDAQPVSVAAIDAGARSKMRIKLVNDGFLKVPPIQQRDVHGKIAKAMNRIAQAGLPTAFIGVYDEVWTLLADLQPAIDTILDGHAALVPNFWANHSVDMATGLGASRRRGGNGVFKDGTPKNITVWMPLTPATPDNGCVYVVPAGQDRNYGKPERADAALPGIRALPAMPGETLIWTGETYHWQARPERGNRDGALLSLTWEFQHSETEPLEEMVLDSYPYMPFETRLGLLARQMPRSFKAFSRQPVWRAVQQTLSNRYPLQASV